MNLFSILQMVLGLMPSVVQGIETVITDQKAGATKKKLAMDIMGSAFTGLATAANLQPNNATLNLVNQLTDVGIETAVAVMNNPPAVPTVVITPAIPLPNTAAPASAN